MAALSARPATFDRTAQARRSMLGKIHIAKKQLGMVDDDYRQLLFDAVGKTSAGDCNDGELAQVIDALRAKGFRPLPPKGAKSGAQHPMARKARALWISLHHLNVVHNPSEQALEAFAKKQLGCEKLQWARQSHGPKLIEALKDMATRNGWKQVDEAGRPLSVLALQEGLCEAILAKLKDAGGADPLWNLSNAAWSLSGWVLGAGGPCSVEEFAALAKALGDELRKAGPVA